MENNYVRLNLWKNFTTTQLLPLDNCQATPPTPRLEKKNPLPRSTAIISHQYSNQTPNNAGGGNTSHRHDRVQEPRAGSGRGGRQQQQQQQPQFVNPGFLNPGYQTNFGGGFMNPPQAQYFPGGYMNQPPFQPYGGRMMPPNAAQPSGWGTTPTTIAEGHPSGAGPSTSFRAEARRRNEDAMEVDDPIPPVRHQQRRDRNRAKRGDDPHPPPRKEASTPQASRYKSTSKLVPSSKGKSRMTEADLNAQDLDE